MAEIKIYGTLVNDTNEAIVKSTQVAAVKQDGTAATQSAVNADLYAKYAAVGNAYRVKGTKATIAEVTALTTKAVGDVWNVTAEFTLGEKKYPAGTNVVWTGSEWDPLGGTVDLAAVEAKIPTTIYDMGDNADSYGFGFKNSKGVKVLEFYVPYIYEGARSGLMTWAEFDKLKGIADGAQVNVIEAVKVNGTALSVASKAVNIDLSAYALAANTLHVADITSSATTVNLKLRSAADATPICNVTFNAATTSAAGLMSAADKQRLDDAASAKNLEATNLVIKGLGDRITALEAALTLK